VGTTRKLKLINLNRFVAGKIIYNGDIRNYKKKRIWRVKAKVFG
jgi:hypothetical protein